MSTKITFSEIVSELAETNGISKEQANDFITKLVDYVLEETRDNGKSAITNFGSFNVVDVAARTGINPRTGEEIVIPEHKRLSFTPYKALEKSVNQEFAHLEAEVVDETLASSPQKTEPEADEDVSLTPEEDPFEELMDIEEEQEQTSELEEGEKESTKKTPSALKRRPERKSTNFSPLAIVAVLVVLAIGVISVWYFTIREQPPISVSTTSAENTSSPAITTEDDTRESAEIYDEDSVVIPMVQENADLSEVSNETIPIENTTPVVQNIPATFATTYSVNSGVWIYEIARQTYGNTRLWPLIFQANYTTANNPDLILPNIQLNIPELEGTADNPSPEDYTRLAEAARYVAEAYQNAGNDTQYDAYIKAADWYETMR
ncbi:MAG: HU family DNA-binding protein [Balneolales bacterium]|nr:HU family DNA-binding protein [Balneolales bacterium]